MHGEAMQFVAAHAPRHAVDVLDVGGRDINGTPRGVFAAKTWTTVDLIDAADVDLVGDICTMGLVDVADVVLCLEVLEHTEAWRDVLAACVAACRPGGRVIVTAAGPGRTPHSALDGAALRDDEFYENIDPAELGEVLAELTGVDVAVDELGHDVRAAVDLPAKKPTAKKAPAKPRKATAKKQPARKR